MPEMRYKSGFELQKGFDKSLSIPHHDGHNVHLAVLPTLGQFHQSYLIVLDGNYERYNQSIGL